MAQGTIYGTTANGSIESKIEWSATSSTANNNSAVTASLWYRRTNTYSGKPTGGTGTVSITIDGQSGSEKKSLTVPNDKSWVKAIEVTKTVSHNGDGTRSITISASGSLPPSSLSSTTCSGTAVLDTIPRYATSVQSLNSKTEETIKMNWSSDSTVDYIWYSKDNGSTWTGINVTDGKSGTYTISGLSANTAYKIKTRVRRKDSQLTTDSSALSVTTYNYPYCTSMPNFTIGDALTLKFYNPLGRAFNFYIIGNEKQIDVTYKCSSTSYVGVNSTTSSVPYLYKTIPNAQSATYKVKVVYGSSTITKTGGTYKIKGTETPTVGSLSYADINSAVTAITGNNQHIVQNKSSLRVTFGVATAKEYASISKYTFTLNGVTKTSTSAVGTVDFGAVNSGSNLTLTMTVTDSRGLTAKTTKTITMVAYSNPTAIVTLKRLNNYEDETYLTVDGSVASVDNKNTMKIEYRYKVSGGSYGSFVTIGDKEKQTIHDLDKNSVFIFNVVVTDVFGSQYNKEYTLGKGVFPLFIDMQKNAVGINDFPAEYEALRVAKGSSHFVDGIKIGGNAMRDFIVEQGRSGMWFYEKWNSGICKLYANIEYTPQSTGYNYTTYNYPFTLFRTPIININITRNKSVCKEVYPADSGGNFTDASKKLDVSFYDVTTTTFNITASVQVISLWK